MDTEIIVAGMSLIGTLGGTFGGILVSNRLVTYRLEQLEKRVDKHNSLIERTYQLEQKNQVQDVRIGDLERALDRLEKQRA